MKLFVQSGRNPRRLPVRGEAWILLENTWNDFSFRTLYSLYLQSPEELQLIGFVKILKKDQVETEVPLSEGAVEGSGLPDNLISRGNSLDYYVTLAELGDAKAREVLAGLRDIALQPSLRTPFEGERGLRVSLHRDEADPEQFYQDARAVIDAGGRLPDEHRFAFEFAPGPGAEPIQFEFLAATPRRFGPRWVGPSRRMVVLVGANGVGKTQLLARLARVAYTPPAERAGVADDGRLLERV